MNRLITYFAVFLTFMTGYAQGGYNPENPGDPSPMRKISVTQTPKRGGSVYVDYDRFAPVGKWIYCSASSNQYYEFSHWLQNGEIVSEEDSYRFLMPDEDVELTAVFVTNYYPGSPQDPEEAFPKHKVVITGSPAMGGWFSESAFKLEEGKTRRVWVYTNPGYCFEKWLLDGATISTNPYIDITMGDKDVNYTATFSYRPVSPVDPGLNMFNEATGEMVIDKFEPGTLESAVYSLLHDYDSFPLVQSIVVAGSMFTYDFYVFRNLDECSLIDLSRTSGYSEIPSYAFEELEAITDVILPSCINYIGYCAFVDCRNLSELSCHALVPPYLEKESFLGVDPTLVVRVPVQSIELYKNAEGWKDFTILPLDMDLYDLTVSLPDDAAEGTYKNMNIELVNTGSGQKYKYIITDKTSYVFGNLPSSTSYDVYVTNSKGDVLGEIKNVSVEDKNTDVKFESLLKPKSLLLTVKTPDGEDVTTEVGIKWYDNNDNLIQQGSSLSGVLENSEVAYTISLNQNLLASFATPAKQNITVGNQASISYDLKNLEIVKLAGVISDAEGNPIKDATLIITQNLGGSYSNSLSTKTDSEGKYEIETVSVPLKVTVSADGYVSYTGSVDSATTGFGEIALEKIKGLTISPGYSLTTCDWLEESGQFVDRFKLESNIAYRAEDENGNEIPGCINQQGAILLPESVKSGEKIYVVAYSKNNKFKEVKEAVILEPDINNVTLELVEYGGVSIKMTSESDATNICVIFDNSGKQVGKSTYLDNQVSFKNLPDGEYTVISMQKSELMGSVSNLTSLHQTQLTEGSDYVTNKVNVAGGKVSEIEIATIPELDESKLYFTKQSETYFMPNKTQVTVGNYVTLKAKVTIKDEFADKIEEATLVIDLPSDCGLVDNSIISGSGYMGYEINGERLSIPIKDLSDAVRFCMVPLDGGQCNATAFVKLMIDGKEVLQPIGSTYFDAKNFSIAAPQKTAKTSIAVRGVTSSDSEVKIYDNEELVGTTYSMPNGEWSARISFVKPYSKSIHEIYAEVTDKEGRTLKTETALVDYNKKYIDLLMITMAYGKNKFLFDQINGKTNVSNYIYWVHEDEEGYQPEPYFTFIADFSNNDPEIIKDVFFRVKMLNGSVRTLTADFNPSTGNWTATSYFTEQQAPVNVSAIYSLSFDTSIFEEDAYNDQIQALVDANDHIIEEFEENVTASVLVDEDEKLEGVLDYGQYQIPFKAEIVDYDYLYNTEMYEKQYNLAEADGSTLYYRIESTDEEIIYTYADPEEELGMRITLEKPLSLKSTRGFEWLKITRSTWRDGSWLRNFAGVAGNLLDIFGAFEFAHVRGDFEQLLDEAVRYDEAFRKMDKRTFEMLLAKCQDGSYKLTRDSRELLDIDRRDILDQTTAFSNQYYQFITDYKWALGYAVVGNLASLGLGKFISKGVKIVKGGKVHNWFNKHVPSKKDFNDVSEMVQNSAGIATSAVMGAGDKVMHPAFYDYDGVRDKIYTWSGQEADRITKEYIALQERIKQDYNECPEDKKDTPEDNGKDNGGDDDDDEEFVTPPVTPSIDPSGYVYEAVPSNRVAGVTASVYYQETQEDMYGDVTSNAVLWDAVPFGQENPLTTDDRGMYGWDVPAGMWQVRFEKEGYETAQSAWLPVPPPQLEVNVAITQAKQPEVSLVHAYTDGVSIEFDKFMIPSSLALGNIVLTQNDKIVEGKISIINPEENTNGETFASKIEFKPSDLLEDGEVTLFVSKNVKSYANLNMAEDFSQKFTVETRISEIKVDEIVEVYTAEGRRINVEVLPQSAAKGKKVYLESFNTLVAKVSSDQATVDENGQFSFDITGLVPGTTTVRIKLEDYGLDTFVEVIVRSGYPQEKVSTPYASVESGAIEEGTKIYLNCDTEDAVIYYTIDGSCPCEDKRIRYEGTPIEAKDDFTLLVMAIAEGMEDSEIAEYTYTVIAAGISEIELTSDLNIYPLPLGEELNITNGDIIIDSASIYDLKGRRVSHSGKASQHIIMDVAGLSSGIYILNVNTNGETIVKKLIKL